jgi:amidase
VTSEVGGILSGAVDALARAGATVVEGWPEGIEPAESAASFGFQIGLFFAFNQPGGELASLAEVIEQEGRRMAARAAWSRYFANMDAFLCPTNFTAPFPHDPRPFEERTIATAEGDRSYRDQPFWIAHPSLAGLPAVAAPVGRTPGGLPVGLQIVGPLYEDDTAITFAELLAEVTGGYQPPPIDARSES